MTVCRELYGRKTVKAILSEYDGCTARSVGRFIENFIFPYKQYESEIIRGVLEGLITCETLGFEDYPCEMTMLRWLIEFSTEVVCT